MKANPIHARFLSLRCKARSKRSGEPCKAPAVNGWQVCRMHGARGDAPDGERNGSYRHGANTNAVKDQVRQTRQLLATARDMLSGLKAE